MSTLKNALIKAGATPKKHPLTPDFVLEDVRRQYLDENVTMRVIAAQYGCDPTTVRDFIIEHGFLKLQLKIRKEMVRKFPASKEEFTDMLMVQNMTQAEIARRLNVSIGTVMRWRKRYGLERQYKPNETRVDEAVIRRMYVDERISMPKISKALGVHTSTVRFHILKMNIAITEEEHAYRRKTRTRKHATTKEGYNMIFLPEHPGANRGGYVAEHRKVIEDATGELLKPSDMVHHIDMQRNNNRIENLALLKGNSEHFMVHRYMDRLCVYMLGLSDIKPPNLKFKEPTFWGGKYIEELDLLAMCDPKDFRLTH